MPETQSDPDNTNPSPFITGKKRYTEGNNATIEEILTISKEGSPPVVKEGWLLKTYNRPRKHDEKTLKHPKLEEVKEHIKILEKDLEGFLTEHHMAISQGEEGPIMRVAVKEVRQSELKQENKQKMAQQMDELIEKALQTYFRTFLKESGTGMVADLEPASVIFGTTISDNTPKLYFVDFFPLTQRSPKELEADITALTQSLTQEYNFLKTKAVLSKLRALNKS